METYAAINIVHGHQDEGGVGIKCINHVVCNRVVPTWWYDVKGNYLCMDCVEKGINKLEFYVESECPICLENKLSVKFEQCTHSVCVDCYRNAYGFDNYVLLNLMRPYPDDESDDDEVKQWYDEYQLMNDAYLAPRTSALDTCPMCRK
jgi:hypothetical protein